MKDEELFTRRAFLKKSSILSAASFLAAPVVVPSSVFGQNAPGNRITMGCIGTGNQGFQDIRGFLENDDLQIVAVCDVNRGSYGYKTAEQFRGREPARDLVNEYYAQNNRAGRYNGCDAYADFREIIRRDDIDAVLIVTPDHWHAIPTIMAARAGKDIYCEKPLSLTITEGRAMVKAVREAGVILQTGTHHRSKQVTRFACELVRNGRIGELQRIIVKLSPHPLRFEINPWQPTSIPDGFDYNMWLGPAPWVPHHKDRCFYTFRFGEDYSGGETTNTGAHAFDIAQWGAGTELTGPVEVWDTGSEWPTSGLFTTVKKVNFRARYANGVELVVTPEPRNGLAARFEGTEGWVNAGWYEVETNPTSLKHSTIDPDEIHLYESNDHYRNFLDCVKTRKDPICPVEVGHRSATVCHLGNIAMKLKRRLHWDPEREEFINDPEANRLRCKSMRGQWHV